MYLNTPARAAQRGAVGCGENTPKQGTRFSVQCALKNRKEFTYPLCRVRRNALPRSVGRGGEAFQTSPHPLSQREQKT